MDNQSKGITLVGLGPGDPSLLTREAWEVLNSTPDIYTPTPSHPAFQSLTQEVDVHFIDEDGMEESVADIVEMGKRAEGIVMGLPGHPLHDNRLGQEIVQRSKLHHIPVEIIVGISFTEAALSALNQPLSSNLSIIKMDSLANKYYPLFPPNNRVLFNQIHPNVEFLSIKRSLTLLYPDDHPIDLVYISNSWEILVDNSVIGQIDQIEMDGKLIAIYLPPLGEHTSFEEFQELIAHLRSPEGCPWDREQTHQSLRRNLMEEAFEALQAIDQADSVLMQEEFGDLLLQIVLQTQIAAESGDFSMSDVIKGIYTKLVHRHPHVFGEEELGDAEDVINNWERIKALERGESGDENKGLLSGIPAAMPSLAVSDAYQRRAGRVGFDWPEIEGVLDKIREEITEFKESKGEKEKAEEMGDMLFALANLARWVGVDPEAALRQTNAKFKQRFEQIEMIARREGKQLTDMSLEEMDEIWEGTKKKK